MKKKGFTLIELIAVISIITVLLTAILGIYVNYAKRSSITRNRTDIQNDFSNCKEKIKNKMRNNSTILLDKRIRIPSSAIDKDLESEKVYLEITDEKDKKESEKVNLLVSFINKNNKEKELYFVDTDKDNLDDEDDTIILKKIFSFEKVTNNVTEFDVKKFNGGFLFDINFSKSNTKRSYEFLLNKKNNELVINSDDKDEDDNNNEESSLDDFFNSISGLTLLGGGNIEVNSSFRLVNSSYFIEGLVDNGQDAGSQLKSIITSKYGNSIDVIGKNDNKGNSNPKRLSLAFSEGDYYDDIFFSDNLSSIIGYLSGKANRSAVLLETNGLFEFYNNYEYITDEEISHSIGVIVKLPNNKYVILINGELTINSGLSNGISMFIYSSEDLIFNGSAKALMNTSIACGEDIEINSPLDLNGQYKVDDATKECISKFLIQ
ncbi:Tfp pilus assembly protein PilE [Clostridium baratii]|uniref:type II secretion system protein n=1 Tax=Clostridium baratii TaxID=1561 RepID=UPI0006BF9592|nr:type II secretion system protein [Clostridium baratii]MDU1053136.1 type II secretion system protein [Clostridium baratii]CUP14352.1 Tfp pilus assembly protein PilE [Clostridium baratii]